MVRHARNDCAVTAKGKPGSGVCKGFFFRNQLLQFIDKTADMKPVADGMVSLNGQRKQAAVLIGIIFPHGKNREQIIVTVLQVQIEPVKGDPGNHGDRKGIRRRAGLWLHSMDIAILFQVLPVGLQKVSEPGMMLRPEV